MYLGSFASAEEAALCVARSPEGQAMAAEQAAFCVSYPHRFLFYPGQNSKFLRRMASASEASSAVPMFGDVFTDINAHYVLGRKLGTGNFAKVVQAACRHDLPQCRLKSGQHVAVKVVKKPQSRSAVERLHMIRAEVEILRSVQHANSEPPR